MLLLQFDIFLFILVASATTLTLIALSLVGIIGPIRKKGILPFSPQSSVPWKGYDFVLLIFLFEFFTIISLFLSFGRSIERMIAGPEPENVVVSAIEDNSGNVSEATEENSGVVGENDVSSVDENRKHSELAEMHPLMQMLGQAKGGERALVIFVAFIVAVIAAPIGEEFFYRGILQGTLQKIERKIMRTHKHSWPFPFGFFSLMLASLWFAGRHFRSSEVQLKSLETLLFGLSFQIFLTAFTLVVAIIYLRQREVSFADMGFDLSHWKNDMACGVGLFAVIFVPIIAMSFSLKSMKFLDGTNVFPPGIADPVTIFFFAIFLGILYLRTHRLLPAIVFHASLNATTLSLSLLALD